MQVAFRRRGYDIAKCLCCGHLCAVMEVGPDHIRQVYGSEYFERGGAGYLDYTSEARLLEDRGRFYGKILREHGQEGGRILDVGCAAGFVANGLRLEGFEVEGLEPNEKMATVARKMLGLNVFSCAFEDFKPDKPYHAVLMLQILSHLVLPGAAIEKAAQSLQAGGLLVIETWDRTSRTARLFGRFWHEWSPPSVLHWFTPREIEALCAKHGLTLIASGRPKRFISLSHGISLVGHSLGIPLMGIGARAVRALGLDATVPYIGDDLFYHVYKAI